MDKQRGGVSAGAASERAEPAAAVVFAVPDCIKITTAKSAAASPTTLRTSIATGVVTSTGSPPLHSESRAVPSAAGPVSAFAAASTKPTLTTSAHPNTAASAQSNAAVSATAAAPTTRAAAVSPTSTDFFRTGAVRDLKAGRVYVPPAWGVGSNMQAERLCSSSSFPDLVLEVIREGVVFDSYSLKGKKGFFLLGSLRDEVDFLYEHPFVSRRHLALQFSAAPPHALFCIDLNSSYGTVCNGQLLKPFEPFLLFEPTRAKTPTREEATAVEYYAGESDKAKDNKALIACDVSRQQKQQEDREQQEAVIIVGGKANTRRLFVVRERTLAEQAAAETTGHGKDVSHQHDPFFQSVSCGSASEHPVKTTQFTEAAAAAGGVCVKPAAASVYAANEFEEQRNRQQLSQQQQKKVKRSGGLSFSNKREIPAAAKGQEACTEKAELPAGATLRSEEPHQLLLLQGEEGEALLQQQQQLRQTRQVHQKPVQMPKQTVAESREQQQSQQLNQRRKFVGHEEEEQQKQQEGEEDEEEETEEDRKRRRLVEDTCEALMFDEEDEFFDRSIATETAATGVQRKDGKITKKRRSQPEELLTESKLLQQEAALTQQIADCKTKLLRIQTDGVVITTSNSSNSSERVSNSSNNKNIGFEEKDVEKSVANGGDEAAAAATAEERDPLDLFMLGVEKNLASQAQQKVQQQLQQLKEELKETKRLLKIIRT